MNPLRSTFVAALALAGLPLASVAAQDAQPGDVETSASAEAPQSRGEARLAKLLEGRVAGEPVNCIRAFPTQRMQTIDGTAYVYGTGNTIWVQRTSDPRQIDDRDTLVTNRFGSTRMCTFDIVTTVDPVTGIFTGVVNFEPFVPYTRAKS